jgi:hypothetical protein
LHPRAMPSSMSESSGCISPSRPCRKTNIAYYAIFVNANTILVDPPGGGHGRQIAARSAERGDRRCGGIIMGLCASNPSLPSIMCPSSSSRRIRDLPTALDKLL